MSKQTQYWRAMFSEYLQHVQFTQKNILCLKFNLRYFTLFEATGVF